MNSNPIITSLLDTDLYKFTMGQFIHRYYPEERVKFAFSNRTSRISLVDVIDEGELREQLEAARSLRFLGQDISFLRMSGLFSASFLDHLRSVRLPDIEVGFNHGQLVLETESDWLSASLWETFALSIVNELASREEDWREKEERADMKIKVLNAFPGIKITDFGTRRRFSGLWHDRLTGHLQRHTKALAGTSNVALAQKYDILPVGTMAHELFMVVAALYDHAPSSLRGSQQVVLKQWEDMYQDHFMRVALTDTWGTDFFFRDFTDEQQRTWAGLRQDSGDPFEFRRKARAFYRDRGMPTNGKKIVFSDGLDLLTILQLHLMKGDGFDCVYGWGTNLTNDTGSKPLSLVMKAVEVNGNPTVKLSDNPAKALGPRQKVEMYKKVFGHKEGEWKECEV